MKKYEKLEYDPANYIIYFLYENKYSNLFNRRVAGRGIEYYTQHKIDHIKESNNQVTAIVHGTIDYHVKIVFLEADKIEVSCECPYHKDTDVYCKHVYALILQIHMKNIFKEYKKDYNNNINKIKEVQTECLNIIDENKEYIDSLYKPILENKFMSYKTIIEKLDEDQSTNNDYRILHSTKNSFYYYNSIVNEYYELLDTIDEYKKDYKKQQKEKRKREIEERKESFSFEMGPDEDALFGYLDSIFDSYDLDTLKKARKECIKNGTKHGAIDKAIAKKERQSSMFRKAIVKGVVSGFFGGLLNSNSSSSTDLMDWEQDYIDKGDYEPYQFEEEDLEEDDYYNEDD